MHGCGNDFIVIDDPDGRFAWQQLSKMARQWCPRRFGVGADGLIAVGHGPLPGESWPDGVDYEMRYVNADGSRAEMCGNGIRCLGKFTADELGDKRETLNVLTGAGVLPVELHRTAGLVESVTVEMGVPKLAAGEIPTTIRAAGDEVISALLELEDERLAVTAINMGNPHAVCFVEHPMDYHVYDIGPELEVHEVFPQRANIEFVQVLSPDRLRLRVWERGVGETQACGTGACASVVAAVLNGYSEHGQDVTVQLNGGQLVVNWPARDRSVRMTGPVVFVYKGEIDTASL
jgi:diaminopimelate epimerase